MQILADTSLRGVYLNSETFSRSILLESSDYHGPKMHGRKFA
jgi:hypothetical protein